MKVNYFFITVISQFGSTCSPVLMQRDEEQCMTLPCILFWSARLVICEYKFVQQDNKKFNKNIWWSTLYQPLLGYIGFSYPCQSIFFFFFLSPLTVKVFFFPMTDKANGGVLYIFHETWAFSLNGVSTYHDKHIGNCILDSSWVNVQEPKQ